MRIFSQAFGHNASRMLGPAGGISSDCRSQGERRVLVPHLRERAMEECQAQEVLHEFFRHTGLKGEAFAVDLALL